MDFSRYISSFVKDSDCKDWNVLNCLQYLKKYVEFKFSSDSRQDILDAFVKVFEEIGKTGTNREKKKAKKLQDNAKKSFQTKEIIEFFENLDEEFNKRRLERSFDNNTSELLIKSGELQTLKLSLNYDEKSTELKRKYNSKEDEASEISYKLKSRRIQLSKEESSTLTTSAEDEVKSGCSDQTYNPSSESEYSIKTKESYYLDYFVGPGEIDWELDDNSVTWVIGENISKICMKYRIHVIQKCNSREILNSDEELALNHIFLFQEENPQGFYEYFDDELWKCMFSEIRTQYPYINISENTFDLCGRVVKIASKEQDPQKRRSEIKSFLNNHKADGEFEEIMHKILSNLVDCYQNSFIINNEIEDTHIHNYVSSVIRPFFPEGKKTTIDWANKTSESSARMIKQFDPSLAGSKPDLIIRTTNPKKFVELMFAEIKPPNKRTNLINEDLVTLGKMMRASLDKSLEDGVNLVICGLHVIGFLGRCYIIDLQYDGIYRMILIGEFKFPEDPATWGTLMSCFQVLATIQDFVNKGAIKYQSATRKGSSQEIPSNLKFKKEMFHFPMKVYI